LPACFIYGRQRLEEFLEGPCLEQVMSNEKRRIYLFEILPLTRE